MFCRPSVSSAWYIYTSRLLQHLASSPTRITTSASFKLLSNLQLLPKATMSELALSTRENSLQSMSSPNPATPPRNGACQWWALPKEISDEILQLAYGTPGKPISMLNGSAFECMQRDRIFDSSNDEKPFKVSSCIPSIIMFLPSVPHYPLLRRLVTDTFDPAPQVRALH